MGGSETLPFPLQPYSCSRGIGGTIGISTIWPTSERAPDFRYLNGDERASRGSSGYTVRMGAHACASG